MALGGVGGVCFGAYTIVGVMGLIAVFQLQGAVGFTVAANVLDSFPDRSPCAMAMRGLMTVAACAVSPMLLLPCRSTLHHLMMIGSGKNLQVEEPEATARLRSSLETLAIMGATVFFGYCGGNLARVFGFTGATAGSLICYMLPPACFIRLRRDRPDEEKQATRVQWSLCWVMLCCMVPLSVVEVCLQMFW